MNKSETYRELTDAFRTLITGEWKGVYLEMPSRNRYIFRDSVVIDTVKRTVTITIHPEQPKGRGWADEGSHTQ